MPMAMRPTSTTAPGLSPGCRGFGLRFLGFRFRGGALGFGFGFGMW